MTHHLSPDGAPTNPDLWMLTLLPLALALSTDAFAAALGRGLRAQSRSLPAALQTGFVFGGVEGLMCGLGWSLGATFSGPVEAFDHWIALILLTTIGLLMIRAGLSGPDSQSMVTGRQSAAFLITLVTAVGTSVDSAAVGTALALSGATVSAAFLIGLSSFLAGTVGFLLAPVLGRRFGPRAEMLGGALLILIGIRIFLDQVPDLPA